MRGGCRLVRDDSIVNDLVVWRGFLSRNRSRLQGGDMIVDCRGGGCEFIESFPLDDGVASGQWKNKRFHVLDSAEAFTNPRRCPLPTTIGAVFPSLFPQGPRLQNVSRAFE